MAKVVKEHSCEVLREQNVNSTEYGMAVQKIDLETTEPSWFLVNYRKKESDVAIGIKYCPYCGKKLLKQEV